MWCGEEGGRQVQQAVRLAVGAPDQLDESCQLGREHARLGCDELREASHVSPRLLTLEVRPYRRVQRMRLKFDTREERQ